MKLGTYTFAESGEDVITKKIISQRQRLQDLMEEIELTDRCFFTNYHPKSLKATHSFSGK